MPQSHRGEAHNVQTLRSAVAGNIWATEPIICVATHGRSFQLLYVELEAVIRLHHEPMREIARDGFSSRNVSLEELLRINYEG